MNGGVLSCPCGGVPRAGDDRASAFDVASPGIPRGIVKG